MDVKKIAMDFVKKFNTRNPSEIVEYLGFVICKTSLGKYSGYYIFYDDIPNICINSNITDNKFSEIVCAHELGHGILHKYSEYPFYEDIFFSEIKAEREANIFTAELLLPDELILNNPGLTKKQLSQLTGYREKLFDFKSVDTK